MLNDLFAPWRDAWTLHLDDDLVVVDKPVGVSTHAPDPVRRDDAVSRLKSWLSARDRTAESAVYLGVHQRLDRDTSGVLLFARRKEANKAVADAFEGRSAKKRYLAVVSPPPRIDGGTLDDLLAPADDGMMQVVTASPRRPAPKNAQRAITRWSVVSRHGNRALVSLEPETGRTHQIRVQLAAMGTPIDGDPLYGKTPAPRLMLHASSLTLPHPATGRSVSFTAETPKELLAWAKGEPDPRSLDERLCAAADQRWELARDPDTTAFRLAHDGDGFASTPVDVYGDWALVHCYDATLDDALAGALLVGGLRGVYVKHRPKQANTAVDTRKESLAPKHAVSGEDAPESMEAREHGLRFEVKLGDGLSTGIFLDQRENRRRVRELAAGKRVLNLFAYTGAFSVAAAAGGATHTTTVDVSAPAIAWARKNLALNGAGDEVRHACVVADVFPWMEAAKARKQVFDLVLLDPPSYATTRDSRFSAASDYPKLAALAMKLVAPGGKLLACTNHHEIARMKFRRWMYEAARAAGREVTQAKDLPAPSDFPPAPGGHVHLKSVLVTLK